MREVYDVIVIGLGGVGSAAAYHLAKRGARVLGFEQYSAGHDQGSSHGETRIIRQAYFEHSHYVPMLLKAYELWAELEYASDQHLFHRTGLVEIGPPDGVVVPGVLNSARLHNLSVEHMSLAQAQRQWPALRGDPDWSVAYEANAGYLKVEQCVVAHLELAEKAGAALNFRTHVHDWRLIGNEYAVTTDMGVSIAKHLVVTAGPWSAWMLRDLGTPLKVLRKHLYWYQPKSGGLDEGDRFPCFFYETQDGFFYGFPSIAPRGLKVARHSGGERLTTPHLSFQTPGATAARLLDNLDRSAIAHASVEKSNDEDPKDRDLVESFLKQMLPDAFGEKNHHAICYYTMSADEHFLVDRLPGHDHAYFVAGLSGHGFKFASSLGWLLADFVVQGRTDLEIAFLQLNRFR